MSVYTQGRNDGTYQSDLVNQIKGAMINVADAPLYMHSKEQQ